MIIVVPIIVLILAGILFILMPAKLTEGHREIFAGRSYSCGGLFDNETVLENSMESFSRAVLQGYGMQLDIWMSYDKKLVVSRDEHYSRINGNKRQGSFVNNEDSQIRLYGTQQEPQQFRDVLKAVDGAVPLILNVSAQGISRRWDEELCMQLVQQLKDYREPVCIASFQPRIILWFKRYAPEMIRIQLLYGKNFNPDISMLQQATYSHCLLNFIGRPHIIAMYHEDQNFCLKISRLLGAMTMLWPIQTMENAERYMSSCDAIIFDSCLPPVRFHQTKEKKQKLLSRLRRQREK